MDEQMVMISRTTLDYITNAIKNDLEASSMMIERAQDIGCREAEKWAEGRKDGVEYIKAILQVSGISFQ